MSLCVRGHTCVSRLKRACTVTCTRSVDGVAVSPQLLCDDVAKGSSESGNTGKGGQQGAPSPPCPSSLTSCFSLIGPGKELVHYMATPLQTPEVSLLGGGGADMPSLLELDDEPFFATDLPEEDTLLTPSQPGSDL